MKNRSLVNIIWIATFFILAVAWSFWKFQYTNKEKLSVIYLQVTTTNPPTGKSLLPEQRRKFTLEFEKKFKGKGMNATVTTTGDFHTTILIQGNIVNDSFVHGMKDNNVVIKDLREMGFKRLILTDGKVSWDIDLKN
ncbi:MAG: hypothetical protein ABSA06_13915 [Geobacteraceae bacterium]